MRSMTFRVCCVAALVALTGLAACGDDSGVSTRDNSDDTTDTTEVVDTGPDTGEADATTTVAPTVATTVPPTVAPTDAPTTTTGEDGEDGDVACGELDPVIDSAVITSSTGLDWDGDGSAEASATVYDTAPGANDFRLRVENGDGGSEVAIITDGVVEPTVLGPVQVDFSLGSSDPQPDELLVTVGANSSGFNLGVFYQDDTGCLARFNGADESPIEIPIHGSIGTASGLACDGGAGSQFIVRTTATASAGSGEYDTHDVKLRREGGQLVDDVDIPGFIVDDGTPESPFLRYSSITNCNVVFGDE